VVGERGRVQRVVGVLGRVGGRERLVGVGGGARGRCASDAGRGGVGIVLHCARMGPSPGHVSCHSLAERALLDRPTTRRQLPFGRRRLPERARRKKRLFFAAFWDSILRALVAARQSAQQSGGGLESAAERFFLSHHGLFSKVCSLNRYDTVTAL
jgi:hypothetical protein